jgi:prepilin-type N-terminal cleavage/methylation domain-containing protein
MSRQSGLTLIELMMVVALAGLVLASTLAISVPWIARESMRSAVYDVQTAVQTAKIEAVSRNRPCRFVIDTSTRIAQVFDGMGTSTTTDDVLLHDTQLTSSVSFARPDSGSAVTLDNVSGSTYQTVFESDGTISLGTGVVCLFGGDRWGRIELFAAGGMHTERWNGSAWETGL